MRAAAALAPCALALALAGGSPAAIPGVPSFYINYNQDCTFSISVDPGTNITATSAPGPTIPPGTYQLLVMMPNPSQGYTCTTPTFSFSGPGVNAQIVFPMQAIAVDQEVTLAASSTYVAEDTTNPSAQFFVSTSATGSSSSLLPPPATGASGSGATQQDIVGSAVAGPAAILYATVSASGKASLRYASRAVASLKAGTYKLEVTDADSRAGFSIERANRKSATVALHPFVGKRTLSVTLGAGAWSFFARPSAATRFTVVAA
jgi:hypothetical protein